MKLRILLFGILLSAHSFAGTSIPAAVLNQKLSAVDYSSDGRQTGCGLRATGETGDGLSLNVLVTVFRKDTGATFGVIKVVARKVVKKDGAPLMQDGQAVIANLGKIQRAWIRPDSGKQPAIDRSGESSHGDAYMVNSEFSGTVDLLIAMSQENFKVGLNRNDEGPDEIFQFEKHLDPGETGKFSVCMSNLRAVLEEGKSKETF
jgi:hypothetical protein